VTGGAGSPAFRFASEGFVARQEQLTHLPRQKSAGGESADRPERSHVLPVVDHPGAAVDPFEPMLMTKRRKRARGLLIDEAVRWLKGRGAARHCPRETELASAKGHRLAQ